MVRTPYVADGYWQKPEASARSLHNQLPGEPGRWLSTADLAFLDGGELFVMGRISDTLIIRGENRYPQAIEWAVAGCHPALNPGGVMAFPVAAGDMEALALACEIRRMARRTLNPDDVFSAVRHALVEQQGLAAERIVLLLQPRCRWPKLERPPPCEVARIEARW